MVVSVLENATFHFDFFVEHAKLLYPRKLWMVMQFLQLLYTFASGKGFELVDRKLAQVYKAFRLFHPLTDKERIRVFKVCQNDQLFDRGIVTDIPRLALICGPPLFGSLSKQRDIQHICLIRVDISLPVGGKFRWNKIFFDGICVDPVICF